MINMSKVLQELAAVRPLFHSEADFQHALAWEVHRLLPNATVRLELPVARSGKLRHVDIWISNKAETFVIELKYKTRLFAVDLSGEPFRLLNQGAQDLGRYDFLKDIYRLEQLTRGHNERTGYAVLLTNDSSYWNPSRQPLAVDSAFRIHEGSIVHGHLAWGADASPGTMRSRETPLELTGQYILHWSPYARVGMAANSEFRFLCITV